MRKKIKNNLKSIETIYSNNLDKQIQNGEHYCLRNTDLPIIYGCKSFAGATKTVSF
ncbi:hypothetical protein [Limnohabitans sp. T6-20]|uniref:hypothetical protein n=1 Tax=Limnohabitans sp. T6-20 TaxID=1100725 RepID=UPI001304C61D|nr:hypothetical protein [Limnohabitans sp. T6-20]